MRPSRRELLTTAGLALLGACVPRRSRVGQMLDGPVCLGWRWIRGMELSYDFEERWRHPGGERIRRERWTYLVREVTQGNATLEGRLVGLGSDAPETVVARERSTGSVVRLEMTSDGRRIPRAGGPCDATDARAGGRCFGADLPHRLLAMHLPSTQVRPADRWDDPDLEATFAALVPSDEAAVEATTELYHLRWDHEERPEALLGHSLLAGGSRGPALRVTGRSRWDTVVGILSERSLLARLDQPSGGDPGELTVQLSRIS